MISDMRLWVSHDAAVVCYRLKMKDDFQTHLVWSGYDRTEQRCNMKVKKNNSILIHPTTSVIAVVYGSYLPASYQSKSTVGSRNLRSHDDIQYFWCSPSSKGHNIINTCLVLFRSISCHQKSLNLLGLALLYWQGEGWGLGCDLGVVLPQGCHKVFLVSSWMQRPKVLQQNIKL